MDQALNSQKTPHTSPLRASYGMSFVSILMKNDRVIKGFYCMLHVYFTYGSRQGITLNKSIQCGELNHFSFFASLCESTQKLYTGGLLRHIGLCHQGYRYTGSLDRSWVISNQHADGYVKVTSMPHGSNCVAYIPHYSH